MECYSLELAQEHLKQGWQSTFLTSEPEPGLPADFPVIQEPWPWNFKNAKVLLEKIKRSGCSVFNLQYVPQSFTRFGLNPALNWILWKIRRELKSRILVTFHEVYEPYQLSRPWRWPIASLQRLQLFLFLAMAHKIIFVIPEHQRRVVNTFPFWKHKTGCVSAFSTVPYATPPKNIEAIRVKWGIGPRDIVLGVFSKTLHHALQLELAMEVSAHLKKKDLATRLLFIGSLSEDNPAYFQKLQAYANRLGEKPIWTGKLSLNEISECLSIVDYYLCLSPDGITSRSGSVMAALQHGKPVICGPSPHMDSFTGFTKAVAMTSKLDTESVQQAILDLEKQPTKSKALREEAQKFYQNSFTLEKISKEILSHYEA